MNVWFTHKEKGSELACWFGFGFRWDWVIYLFLSEGGTRERERVENASDGQRREGTKMRGKVGFAGFILLCWKY